MTWTLILMFLSFDGAEIESVPGFKTQNKCQNIGEIIVDAKHKWRGTQTFICVEIKS